MEIGDVFVLDTTPGGFQGDGLPEGAPRHRIIDLRCPTHGSQRPLGRGGIVFLQTKETLAEYRCPECGQPIIMATEPDGRWARCGDDRRYG